MKTTVSILMFVHNEEKHISEALESLLSQTYKNFKIYILDDCSTDRTVEILKKYKRKDKRIALFYNSNRQGYAYNYKEIFMLANPQTKYFAWVAGHDLYRSRWLEELVQVLETYPKVVMTYSLTQRIDDKGKIIKGRKEPEFDTFGLSLKERILKMHKNGLGYGNMIYGLFRTIPVRNVGIFPALLVPDMALLMLVHMSGSIFQVKKILWCRRYINLFSIKRQLKTVFSIAPLYAYIPWPILNTIYLFWKTCLFPTKEMKNNRKEGFLMSALFFRRYYTAVREHYGILVGLLVIPIDLVFLVLRRSLADE